MLGKENVLVLFTQVFRPMEVYVWKRQLGVFVGYFIIICLITVKLITFLNQTLTNKALHEIILVSFWNDKRTNCIAIKLIW